MNIINVFFKGGGTYNKVSLAIGVLSLIFSVISYYSAHKAKANAANAADMAKQVSGKLDILENQLAYTNKLKNEYEQLLKSAQNYMGVLVKHFCNTLFDKYLSVTSFHWC